MTSRSEKTAWERVLLIAVVAIAVSFIQPAEAKDYTRSCRASLEVRAAGTSTARKAYQWSVSKTVSGYHPNAAREEARRAIVTCMQTHWEARDAGESPSACQSFGSLRFNRYPFGNLAERLHNDLCAAYPGENSQDVDLVLFVEGDTGCVVDGGNINPATRKDIASNYRITFENCPAPLQGVRLPGNDISVTPIPGQDWRACAHMCQDNAACRAWTWRAAGTSGAGSPENCLQKSAAGTQITDTCCHSGIKD